MCLYAASESLEINHRGRISTSTCNKATVLSHLTFCSPPRAWQKKKKNRASFCYLIFFKKLLSTWQKHAKTIMVKETTTMKPNGSNDKGIGALFSVEKLCQHLKDLQCSYYRFRKGYWCWEGLKAKAEEGDRDGWMASRTKWTWVWAGGRVKDREAWYAGIHGVSNSQTWLSDWTTCLLHEWTQTDNRQREIFLSKLPIHIWGIMVGFCRERV